MAGAWTSPELDPHPGAPIQSAADRAAGLRDAGELIAAVPMTSNDRYAATISLRAHQSRARRRISVFAEKPIVRSPAETLALSLTGARKALPSSSAWFMRPCHRAKVLRGDEGDSVRSSPSIDRAPAAEHGGYRRQLAAPKSLGRLHTVLDKVCHDFVTSGGLPRAARGGQLGGRTHLNPERAASGNRALTTATPPDALRLRLDGRQRRFQSDMMTAPPDRDPGIREPGAAFLSRQHHVALADGGGTSPGPKDADRRPRADRLMSAARSPARSQNGIDYGG
jgi:hypothetical protein